MGFVVLFAGYMLAYFAFDLTVFQAFTVLIFALGMIGATSDSSN